MSIKRRFNSWEPFPRAAADLRARSTELAPVRFEAIAEEYNQVLAAIAGIDG